MSHELHHHRSPVKLYIDRVEHESPNPTTGAALNLLGKVQAGYVLFREMEGKTDDQRVPNDQAEHHLKEWEHFYTAQGKLNPGADA